MSESPSPTTASGGVTIAIPVHNGADHLAEALDSALGQTRPADRVVVWDNASTDNSVEVALSRLPAEAVRRSPTNVGAARNFDRAATAASTEWFMWLAADDRLDPRYLEECLRAADGAARPPDAVLSGIRIIDGAGDEIRAAVDHDLGSPSMTTRARAYVRKSRWTESYCLFRHARLMESPRFQQEYATDVLLIWWYLLRGPLLVVDSLLLDYREATARTVEEMAESLLVREPDAGWRKVRLFRRMWEMAGEPGVAADDRRRARIELLRGLMTTAAALHLDEDIRLRRAVLRVGSPTSWRRSRIAGLGAAHALVRLRERVVVRHPGGAARESPETLG